MKSSGKITAILKIALSFFIALSVFVLTVCVEVKLGFLRSEAVMESATDSGYIEKMSKQMEKDLKEVLTRSGMPKSVTESLTDSDTTYVVVKNGISKGLEGKKAANTEAVEDFTKELRTGIEDYIATQQISLEGNVKTAVETIVAEAGGIYGKYANSLMAIKYYDFKSKTDKKVLISGAVSLLIAGLGMVLLFKMSKHRHRALRYIVYSLCAAGIWNITGLIKMQQIIGQIKSRNFSVIYMDFIHNYLDNAMTIWYIMNIVLWAAVAVLLYIIRKLKITRTF